MLAKAQAGNVAVELALLLLVLAHTDTVAVSGGGGDSPEGGVDFLLLVSVVELTSDTNVGLLVGGCRVLITLGLATVESILINGGNCLSCGGSR